MRNFISSIKIVSLSLASVAAYGQSYSLDPTFGTAGKTLLSFPTASTTDAVKCLVLQADGRILVAGQNANASGIGRLTASGQPDATFGTAGTVTTVIVVPVDYRDNVSTQYNSAQSLVVQPDGKIVAAGNIYASSGTYRTYARYLPTGTLDTSFGGNYSPAGVYVPFRSGSLGSPLNFLRQQADGKLLSVGTHSGLSGRYFEITRLQTSGADDASYVQTYPATGNEATTSTGAGPNVFKAPADGFLDNSGRLVTAGAHTVNSQTYVGPQGAAIVRFLSTGSYDSSFGTNGITVLPATDRGKGLSWTKALQQADGKIVVASIQTRNVGNSLLTDSVAIARYQTNGTLDPSFGRQGLRVVAACPIADGTNTSLCGLQPLPAGGFLLGVQTPTAFGLVQVGVDGQPITSAAVLAQLQGMRAVDMAVQPDGKVLVAGDQTAANNTKQFAVARLVYAAQLAAVSPVQLSQAQLYPNPATQQVSILLTGAIQTEQLKLQLIDALGREVLVVPAARPVAGEIQLSLQAVSPGTYTLRMQSAGFALTKRLIRTE